jgi:ParB family chromosome partitioning protein
MNSPVKKSTVAGSGRPHSSGLGLDSMGDLSSLLDAPTASVNGGGPLLLDMDLIDEDPNQPRTEDNPGFSDESLAEMAASVQLRGVKTPISVRENRDAPGRFIINHGARRYRGSKRAGKTQIPAFIDNDYNEADQVVENLQRNELTAREIADAIGRELAKGVKKIDIAKAFSKSPAFISQHVTLLDLPDPVADIFNKGRLNDVTLTNELVNLLKKKPQEVTEWLSHESQDITRGSVKLLREFLDDKGKSEQEKPAESTENEAKNAFSSEEEKGPSKTGDKPADPDKLKKAIVKVQHNDRPARLILNRRPPADGYAWLKYEDDGHEFEANLLEVRLTGVIEG